MLMRMIVADFLEVQEQAQSLARISWRVPPGLWFQWKHRWNVQMWQLQRCKDMLCANFDAANDD